MSPGGEKREEGRRGGGKGGGGGGRGRLVGMRTAKRFVATVAHIFVSVSGASYNMICYSSSNTNEQNVISDI